MRRHSRTSPRPQLRFDDLYEPVDRRPVGLGGYGAVYKYRQKATNEIVAVKIVKPARTRDEDPEALLRREISILRDLTHPNIIALKDPHLYHSVDEQGADVYRFAVEVMDEEIYEYLHDPQHVHPRPLTSHVLRGLRPQRLPMAEIKHIVWQIAKALQYIHSKNIIHRDIKLENIMRIISTGRVKLIDFGLARVLEGLGNQTSRIGSRRYMAPEVTDRRARYTVKADVWSLGVTIFLLLARRYPFKDETDGWPMTEKLITEGTDCFGDADGQEALHLIRHMLEEDQMKRYSINDVLRHPWLSSVRGQVAGIDSELASVPEGRTDELLLYIDRGTKEPLRVYLSKLNLTEVQDPSSTILVSSFKSNVHIVPDPVRTEGHARPAKWITRDAMLNPGGRKGSLGRIVERLNIGEGEAVDINLYTDHLCEIEAGNSNEYFRKLWLVLLEGRQNRDFVWSVYSSLRENVRYLASEPSTHIIMSLIGYEKRAADGTMHTEDKLFKMSQSIVQEIAGFALEASQLVPAENLRRITVVAWEELFDRIKEGFKLCGRAEAVSVLSDPKYLPSVIYSIWRMFASPGCDALRKNVILTSYIENLQVREDTSPTSSALQVCYWGGRIGRFLRSQGWIPSSSSEVAGVQRDRSNSQTPDDPEPMRTDSTETVYHAPAQAAGGVQQPGGMRSSDGFILNCDHAFEILERNICKTEEQWMPLLTLFDAAATLHAIKFLLEHWTMCGPPVL